MQFPWIYSTHGCSVSNFWVIFAYAVLCLDYPPHFVSTPPRGTHFCSLAHMHVSFSSHLWLCISQHSQHSRCLCFWFLLRPPSHFSLFLSAQHHHNGIYQLLVCVVFLFLPLAYEQVEPRFLHFCIPPSALKYRLTKVLLNGMFETLLCHRLNAANIFFSFSIFVKGIW